MFRLISFRRLAAATALLLAAGLTVAPAALSQEPATCNGKTDTGTAALVDGAWHGTDGDDVIIVMGTATVYGHKGNDTICRSEDSEAYGFGYLYGGRGHDEIFSDWGHDYLHGERGSDYLYGGRDNDYYYGGRGADTLDGACNGCPFEARYNDRAIFRGLGPVKVDLYEGTAESRHGTDTIVDIDDVTGGSRGDVIVGNAARNRISGHGGKDRLFGYGGDDSLEGNKGHDSANGGKGIDRCSTERKRYCEKD